MKPIAACLVAGLVALWAGEATAHPGYPLVVKDTLQLTAIFDPSGPNGGCYLCHQTTGGGTPLRPFGTLLVQQYGLSSDPVNEDDPSLASALGELQAGPDAHLVTDIKNGIDPNNDPVLEASALPTPEYGCGVAARATSRGPSAVWLAAALFALALRARRAATQLERPVE